MKKIILLLLLVISYNINAQRFKEVLKWEVETKAGGIVFGISETEEEANYIMQDFQKRNTGSKYEIIQSIPKYKYTTISVKNSNDDLVEAFTIAAGKPYKVLSAEDIESLELIKSSSFKDAVAYYVATRNTSEKYATDRLKNLNDNLEKYRIQSPKYLASSIN